MVMFLTADALESLLAPHGGMPTARGVSVADLAAETLDGALGQCVAAQPPNGAVAPYFAQALTRWMPTGRRLILAITRVETGTATVEPLVLAARRGLGEARAIAEAPAMLFEAAAERGKMLADAPLLAGFLLLVMAGEWDGWLLAEGAADRIEFWQGHVMFYSGERARLKRARRLVLEYECRIGFE